MFPLKLRLSLFTAFHIPLLSLFTSHLSSLYPPFPLSTSLLLSLSPLSPFFSPPLSLSLLLSLSPLLSISPLLSLSLTPPLHIPLLSLFTSQSFSLYPPFTLSTSLLASLFV